MLRIGDFSRLARVTIKTLHHYAEAGVLRPAHVDPQTGYRYYTADQLERLQQILMLKDVGFSLEEIGAALGEENRARLAVLLQEHRERLTRNIAEDQLRLKRLVTLSDDALDRSISATTAVVLREIAAIDVYAKRARVPSVQGCITAMFEAAEAAVARHQARADASPFLLFHDSEWREQDIDVEVCIPLSSTVPALTVRQVESAPRAACVTYSGNYDQTQTIYDAMLQWLDRNGLQICGPLREVYHRYGAEQVDYALPSQVLTTSSSEYVTELQVPVIVKS